MFDEFQKSLETCIQITLRPEIGILLPKLFWPTGRKNCFGDQEKLFKFEAEGREFSNFQIFWDYFNNFFKQWKVRTISGNRMLFWLVNGGFSDLKKIGQSWLKLENTIGSLKSAGKPYCTLHWFQSNDSGERHTYFGNVHTVGINFSRTPIFFWFFNIWRTFVIGFSIPFERNDTFLKWTWSTICFTNLWFNSGKIREN